MPGLARTPALPRSPARAIAFAALSIGMGLLLLAIPVEFIARRLDPNLRRLEGLRNPFWIHHPTRGHALQPNFHGTSIWGVPFRINSMGFRGPELAWAKPAGTFRVLVLGDSIVMGSGLSVQDTLPALLQQELADRFPGPRFEVINAGVSGYGLPEEYTVMKEDGLRLDPDLVVLGFCLNDVPGTVFADHINPRRDLSFPGKQFLLTHLALARFFQERYNRIGLRNDFLGLADWLAAAPGSAVDRRVQAGWAAYRQQLRPLLSLCREHRIHFLFVAFPHQAQFEDRQQEFRPQRELARLAREMDFDLLDPAPDFRPVLERVYIFGDPVHPSGFGQRLLARRIGDYIQKNIFN
jgi:lysophospholipase L1-like esterase